MEGRDWMERLEGGGGCGLLVDPGLGWVGSRLGGGKVVGECLKERRERDARFDGLPSFCFFQSCS